MIKFDYLKKADKEVYDALDKELARQRDNIELIASENFVSPAVMQAVGSHLTNKYAEGYPGKRYYGGCGCVDIAETLAIERAKKLLLQESMSLHEVARKVGFCSTSYFCSVFKKKTNKSPRQYAAETRIKTEHKQQA